MDALILAAGEGTRMRPLTANIPKSLIPVAGKPFLEHLIFALKESGVKDITVLVGWHDEKMKEYLWQKFGSEVSFLEQKERLGTAHAVGVTADKFKSDFLCVNGDIVVRSKTIKELLKYYRKHKHPVMALKKVDDTEGLGVVSLKNGKVTKITEKPRKSTEKIVNAGIYIFTPEIFDAINETKLSPRGEYEITDSIEILLRKTSVYGFLITDEWIDVGRPWDLLDANKMLQKDIKCLIDGEVEKYATIHGNVQIGKHTVVRNGSYIIGPTIIDENCEIGPNCLIRPSTYIGKGCKIGSCVEIKNSIILSGTDVPHLSYVGDSIIGERCNLGAGTKIANLRLDEHDISVILKGEKVSTKRRKLGAIIGDDVKIGINVSIDVGTLIGEETMIGPNAVVSGTIAPRSRIY